MISPKRISEVLEKALPGARAEARDLTGTNDHFGVTVICEAFQGKNPVARHRLVYGALAEWVASGEIHALTIEAFTPAEAGSRNSNG